MKWLCSSKFPERHLVADDYDDIENNAPVAQQPRSPLATGRRQKSIGVWAQLS